MPSQRIRNKIFRGTPLDTTSGVNQSTPPSPIIHPMDLTTCSVHEESQTANISFSTVSADAMPLATLTTTSTTVVVDNTFIRKQTGLTATVPFLGQALDPLDLRGLQRSTTNNQDSSHANNKKINILNYFSPKTSKKKKKIKKRLQRGKEKPKKGRGQIRIEYRQNKQGY